MITIKGQGVSQGIVFGKLELIKASSKPIERRHIDDADKEWKRFFDAKEKAKAELLNLYNKAVQEVGEDNAMIFEIHRMMIDDKDYLDSVKANIEKQLLNAESAAAITSDNFSEMFRSMDDAYMRARATDVEDITERIINILSDSEDKMISKAKGKVIIGAKDLAPSQTVQLDKSKILAFITEEGSVNSHTSILSRTMGIPAIIKAKGITDENNNGKDVIVDGYSGEVYINPDMSTVLKMQNKKHKSDERSKLLDRLKGVESKTIDGKSIKLYANIGGLEDMVAVYANDAMGVGLFRSEFIYLEGNNYPSEEKQFAIYKSVAQKAFGKRVIIRTLDIGADKVAEYFKLPKEENPALGVRAIRLCLKRPKLFKTQLRAIYRASAFGQISIMFPMITSVSEIKRIKELCHEVCVELKSEGVAFNDKTELGIMIETPASAIISDLLAKEVQFFSIGTNDLTQYSLAIDRQNPDAEEFLDTKHTAVLRLIKMVVDNAHRNGIWAGICGELAGDTDLTELFLAMGVDELSVSPNLILPIKEKIIETDISKVKDAVIKRFLEL